MNVNITGASGKVIKLVVFGLAQYLNQWKQMGLSRVYKRKGSELSPVVLLHIDVSGG